ncbi:hypothetical protein V7S43_015877 [Phytophthora oleae]|uniref:CCHC-type domain-containing protein n=1 Tax=Phytophthora oleae TaxID=2107226 RepID=A0ABD3EXJ9_9STRA
MPQKSNGDNTRVNGRCHCVPPTTSFPEECNGFPRATVTVQDDPEAGRRELVLKLSHGKGVKASRQSTRALKEDILLAAERSKVNIHELHQMMNLAKTISYNHAQQAIHFFFFDRATAKKFELVAVPYKGMVHRVRNMHGPDVGTVWGRQLDRYGVRTAERTMYEVKLYNITRFMDIGWLTAYLQKHIAAEVELEDMDVCTPNSRTSTIWKLTVKMAGCPEFLRGIVRILWFCLTIILKHPSVGQRLQCLRCGNLRHVMARCEYTTVQLADEGSRVAKETEVANLEDLAKPFASMEEVRKSAAQRLGIQEAEEKNTDGFEWKNKSRTRGSRAK